MSIISIISFSLCLIILIYSLKKEVDLFSPAKVFTLIWAMSIGITDLKLSRFQHEWNFFEWLMLGIGISSFLIGTFVVYVIHMQNKPNPLLQIRNSFNQNMLEGDKLLHIIYAVFVIYVLSYVGNYLAEGYIPVFSKNPGVGRMGWGTFGIGLTIHTATPLLLITTIYLKLIKPRFLLKTVLISIMIFTFFSYLLLLQRFNLMFAIIAMLVFLYYSSNFLRLRNALIVLFLIFGLIYSVQFLRMSSLALNYLYMVARMKFSFKYAIFTEPYMYIAMNLENFTRAAERLEVNTYGFFSFNFLTSISGTRIWLEEYFGISHFPFLISNTFNTYSMFWDFYRDFGVIGLSLMPFILGLSISSVYYNLMSKPSITNLSIYSVCIFIIFMSFFANVSGLLHFVFNFSLIIIITRIVQKKNGGEPDSLKLGETK